MGNQAVFSPLENRRQGSMDCNNIFKLQKKQIRTSEGYSSNRNYLELLANEKQVNFNPEDLERIQRKASQLHWLSSIDENPYPLRRKEYVIKHIPRGTPQTEQLEKFENDKEFRNLSSLDQSYYYAQMALNQFKRNLNKIEQYNQQYPASPSKKEREKNINFIDEEQEQKKKEDQKAMKGYLTKIKCIDPEKMKVIKKKLRNRQLNLEEQDTANVLRSVSLPQLHIGKREEQILRRVKINIDQIQSDSQSVVIPHNSMPLGESVLSNTIHQTQSVLRQTIDETNLQRQKDLERKNFLMNVIGDNTIIDQKSIQYSEEKVIGKNMQTQMKQIYTVYNKDSLQEVARIRHDSISQAFKKKAEKDLKENKKGETPQAQKDPNTALNFEDTPSNINLLFRARQRLEEVDIDIPPNKSKKLQNSFSKKHIYLIQNEDQVDPQYEDMNRQNVLPMISITEMNTQKINDLEASRKQSNSLISTIINNKRSQADKINEFLEETKDKISRLKKENAQMKMISEVHENGESEYKKKYARLNKVVFNLTKDNQVQELYRFLKIHGEEFANAIDKVFSIVQSFHQLGETPLHWAVKRNFVGCVEVLLNFGANPNAEDSFQRTPYMLAEKNKFGEIERMLKLAIAGKFESTLGKFEARELLLEDPKTKKMKEMQQEQYKK